MIIGQSHYFQPLPTLTNPMVTSPEGQENAATKDSLFATIEQTSETKGANNQQNSVVNNAAENNGSETDTRKSQTSEDNTLANSQTPGNKDGASKETQAEKNAANENSATAKDDAADQPTAKAKLEQQQLLLDQQKIQQLATRDREVRNHERAHASAGGKYAGSPIYEYTRGPDGKSYATGGHVDISLGEEATPERTIDKMQIIKQAALAPLEPSAEDRRAAAAATKIESEARVELFELKQQEQQQEQQQAEEKVEQADSTAIAPSDPNQSANEAVIDAPTASNQTDNDTANSAPAEPSQASSQTATVDKVTPQSNRTNPSGQKIVDLFANVMTTNNSSKSGGFSVSV